MSEQAPCPTPWGGNPSREVSEARFQTLFDEADAMAIQGYYADGTVVYWNRASEKVYGYTAAEALGGNLLDLIIPPEMRQTVELGVQWMFENGRGVPPGRLDLRHKDGHSVPVYSSHTIVTVPGQVPVLFCMDSDMSELAHAEAELRVAATAFESQQGMIITDAQGLILRVNEAFTRGTGYSAHEAVGQTPRLIQSGRHPADFYKEMWRYLLATGHWQGELWNQRKSGEVYAVWVTISAVTDGAGRVTHYVGTQTDMTQRKEAEAVGEAILASLNEVYSLAAHEYVGSASIGITLFSSHETSIDELMKQADLAMYGAKAAGRNTLRLFISPRKPDSSCPWGSGSWRPPAGNWPPGRRTREPRTCPWPSMSAPTSSVGPILSIRS